MKTFGSLFSGGGGADIGAKAAGLELAWGIEYVPEIAAVANANLGQHIKVANILDCNPLDFDRVDVLHASPPCPSFSVAKANGAETELDIALARKVAEFATVLRPEVFTLENVQAYQKSKSWRIIEGALHEAGYWLSVSIVNFADLGVPQTRRRMIVRAVRGGFVPYLPQPERWVGWYEAISDIIGTLPDSQFAEWQRARLPETIEHGSKAFIVDCQKAGNVTGARGITIRYAGEPCFTLTSGTGQRRPARAYDGVGRVVAMTVEALGIFQSFPPGYKYPPSKTLAAKIIGNAVPPLGFQKIIGGLL